MKVYFSALVALMFVGLCPTNGSAQALPEGDPGTNSDNPSKQGGVVAKDIENALATTSIGPQGPVGLAGPQGEKGDPGETRIVYVGGQRIELIQHGHRTVAAKPVGHQRVYQEVEKWHPASVTFVEARDAKTLAEAKAYARVTANDAAIDAKGSSSPLWLGWLSLVVGLIALALHLVGRIGRPIRPYRP